VPLEHHRVPRRAELEAIRGLAAGFDRRDLRLVESPQAQGVAGVGVAALQVLVAEGATGARLGLEPRAGQQAPISAGLDSS
jgi:hypothetical protein